MLPHHHLSGAGASPRCRVLSSRGCHCSDFALTVLRMVTESSIDGRIRQAAVISFMNHQWSSDDATRKEQIKTLIVSFTLSTTPKCFRSSSGESLKVGYNILHHVQCH